jgi:hypothetical protein
MASRSAQDHYSDKSEQSQDDRELADVPLAGATTAVTDDDDLLTDLDLTPAHEAVSDAEIMAALDAIPNDGPDDPPIAPEPATAGWLTDIRELARKHGPFAPWQIVQIICALNAGGDPAVETGIGR